MSYGGSIYKEREELLYKVEDYQCRLDKLNEDYDNRIIDIETYMRERSILITKKNNALIKARKQKHNNN